MVEMKCVCGGKCALGYKSRVAVSICGLGIYPTGAKKQRQPIGAAGKFISSRPSLTFTVLRNKVYGAVTKGFAYYRMLN